MEKVCSFYENTMNTARNRREKRKRTVSIVPTVKDSSRPQAFHKSRKGYFTKKNACKSKRFFYGVSDGIQTHDLQGHNLAL